MKNKIYIRIIVLLGISIALVFGSACNKKKEKKNAAKMVDKVSLLHVSFDIAREIGKQLTAGFVPWYEEKTGLHVKIEQSNGGSSRQARAVSDGLPADVVSMNQYLDIDLLYEHSKDRAEGALIKKDWQNYYPNNSSPASSTMAFVVRNGNPKNIRDWDDLTRDGVEIVAPNYRSTGNGRYSFLTAYAYGLHKYKGVTNNKGEAYAFTKKLVENTVVLAQGGRAATNVFVEREVGDVLLTFEAEVNLIVNDLDSELYEVVVPSYGVDAKLYVVVVEQNAQKKGEASYAAARAFWDFIYTEAGQEIIAKTFFRPINKDIARKYQNALPNIELFDIDEVFGGWKQVKAQLFSDDGVVAKIYEDTGKN